MMKVLLCNVRKLYGDVGKQQTGVNLCAWKACSNGENRHHGWQSPEIGRQSSALWKMLKSMTDADVLCHHTMRIQHQSKKHGYEHDLLGNAHIANTNILFMSGFVLQI